MASTVSSNLTVQKCIDYARSHKGTRPTLGVAGYTDEPALTYMKDIVQKIMNKSNPWKWNQAKIPVIQTQPYQQDYPTQISQNTMGWLQAGVVVDINNTSTPKPIVPVNCVQALLPSFITDRPGKVCWIPNKMAQTATWGGANKTDPVAGTVYTDPLTANSGGPSTNPYTAITDTNGNIQLITTYGVLGTVQPTWPAAKADAGTTTTDGTAVWTVQDPNGIALRVDALATFNSVVWEFRIVYQKKPPSITTLGQTLDPIPDDLDYLIKSGFMMYARQDDADFKFDKAFSLWMTNIQEAMGASDREYQEFGMHPAQPLQGGFGGDGNVGTWGYPGWPGWQ